MTSVGQLAIGAGLTTLYYPVAYAKVLIQIGHEPLQPRLSTTLFGNRVYMYPNVFKYIGHIYRTDGFFGLYRGLGSKLISFAISNYVTNTVQANLSEKALYCKEYEEIDDICLEVDDFSNLMKDTSYEVLSRCAGIICSQPFYVIAIRSMAQFVGRETRFSSVFSSIPEIWKSEGILGFFAGLIPRLVCEILTIVIANSLAFGLNAVIAEISQQPSNPFKTQTCMASQLVASQLTYPINLVSVIMTVNSAGLAAGALPNMPVFDNWMFCFNHLKSENQIKRGSSLFWRRYYGQKMLPIN